MEKKEYKIKDKNLIKMITFSKEITKETIKEKLKDKKDE